VTGVLAARRNVDEEPMIVGRNGLLVIIDFRCRATRDRHREEWNRRAGPDSPCRAWVDLAHVAVEILAW